MEYIDLKKSEINNHINFHEQKLNFKNRPLHQCSTHHIRN